MTLLFVAIVTTIVFVVASPSGRDALAIFAFELGLGTLAILIFAQRVCLIATIPAIVSKVALPLFRYAPVIGALEVHYRITFRTVFRTLVRTVAAIIFAVAE